jgi:4-hydroxythreonine-4-phosphate dehydrogenase
MSNQKPIVAFSIGDLNGVGSEVIIKSLSDQRINNQLTPVIYANVKLISSLRKQFNLNEFNFHAAKSIDEINVKRINVINCWEEEVTPTFGAESEIGGKYAFLSLKQAVHDLKHHKVNLLVTAPIQKHAIQQEGFLFPGHTEYLESEFQGESLMIMLHESLRVALVTGHIPVSQIAEKLKVEKIVSRLRLFNQSLKMDFGIDKPKIAVLGLNPHAGDQGLLGQEDQSIIIPAVEAAQNEGIFAMGPYAADGFFGKSAWQKFDGVLAMYHDQGLIPFKTISFGRGVNYTAGLDVIRTSPDHGTGFDIAGKGKASPSSLLQAIFYGLDILRTRTENQDLIKNALPSKPTKEDKVKE